MVYSLWHRIFLFQSVRIWDILNASLNEDNPAPLHIIHNCHNDWVTDVKWSNIADVIITSANDFNLKIWDVSKIGDTPGETHKASTGKNICKEKYTLTGHMAAVNHIGFSVCGTLLDFSHLLSGWVKLITFKYHKYLSWIIIIIEFAWWYMDKKDKELII